jgi:hypothetical protein
LGGLGALALIGATEDAGDDLTGFGCVAIDVRQAGVGAGLSNDGLSAADVDRGLMT